MGERASLSGWGMILGIVGAGLLAGTCAGGVAIYAVQGVDWELPELPEPEPALPVATHHLPTVVEQVGGPVEKDTVILPKMDTLRRPSLPLQVFAAGLGQGMAWTQTMVSFKYSALCEGGVHELACAQPVGLGSLPATLSQSCEAGDAVSCVIYGWERTQLGRRGERDGRRGELLWTGVHDDVSDSARDIEGADAFHTACELGEPRGCGELGRAYGWGIGRAHDPDSAALLFEAACQAGDALSCAWWGDAAGWGGDDVLALERYLRSCEAGSGEGCRAASSLEPPVEGGGHKPSLVRGCEELNDGRACTWHFENLTATERADEGIQGLERLCAEREQVGLPYACDVLAGLYLNGTGVAQDEARAVALNRQACEGGDRDGCSHLAFRYQDGRGVELDLRRALLTLRQACDWDHAEGCRELGEMRFGSELIDPPAPDAREALAAMEKGCDLGDGESCNRLALILVDGDKGVEAAKERVGDLHERACELEFGWGCYNQAFWSDDGTQATLVWTAERYLQACALEIPEGCLAYSKRLMLGSGVSEDWAKALEYLEQACGMGLKDACE